VALQILLSRAQEDFPRDRPPPLRFIRSCSSSLAAPTLHKLEATFKVPVLEVKCSLGGMNSTASHQDVFPAIQSLDSPSLLVCFPMKPMLSEDAATIFAPLGMT